MGSKSDLPFVKRIVASLDALGINSIVRVSSAHKTPRRLLNILDELNADDQPKVYITVAGRSNALSGMVDASVSDPVIACPPPSDRFAGADLYSSLRMPSGVAPAVVLEPSAAALLAAKILSLTSPDLRKKVQTYQHAIAEKVNAADRELNP